MSTYKDAPQDIRDTAAMLIKSFGGDLNVLQGAIAAALLREREGRTTQAPYLAEEVREALDNGSS